jgi:hypothetical protein
MNHEWIDIDLADLGLPAPLTNHDEIAEAVAHVYERFVPYADAGWEWIGEPGSADFEGWRYQMQDGQLRLAGVRLLSRCHAAEDERGADGRNGVSMYRTRQLTQRPWTAEPGSKRWKELSPR